MTRPHRLIRLLSAAALAAGLAVTPAAAQEEGVFVDPESPSGKEYAIPLESARRLGDPSRAGDRQVVQGERTSQLFGVGISGGDRSRSGSGGSRRTPGERRAAPSRTARERHEPALRAAIAQPGAPAGGLSTPLLAAASGLLVLAAGAGAGYAVRRRRDRD